MGTGWSEEKQGWQDPTAQALATERNHLPGPAYTLTPPCSVKTLLCENCARVSLPAEKKKPACMSLSINPLVCESARVKCMRARDSTWWTEQLVPEGGQPLSTGTQTYMFACEKQSSL